MKMRLLVAAIALVGLSATTAHAQSVTGALRGTVTDPDNNNAPLSGATIVATSTALQGEEVALSDENGRYVITNLPSGEYRINYSFAGVAVERTGVRVLAGQTVTVDIRLATSQAQGEVLTVEAPAPSVDVSSTTVGTTVTREFIESVPLGRTRDISSAINVLPSASNDRFGTSIGGTTSPENQFMIDGLSTNDIGYGLQGQRLVLEFVEQVNIKEGGYQPEFGRATGGYVEAITKSGGNEFHGTVFTYWRPGFLSRTSKRINRAGESIAESQKLGHYLNAGFEIGGPIIKDKLWFHAGYAPEFQQDRWTRTLRARVPGADGNALLDADGAFVTEDVASDRFDSNVLSHQFTGKLTHLINSNLRHSLSVTGAPTYFKGIRQNPFASNPDIIDLNNAPNSARYKENAGNMSALYRITGKFFDNKLQLDGSFGWFHNESIIKPVAGDGPGSALYSYNYARNYRDVAAQWGASATPGVDAPECQAGADFANGQSRCVVQGYGVNGYGLGNVKTTVADRFAERLSITHIGNFAGLHQLKYGIDFEQNAYYNRRRYGGGGFKTVTADFYANGDDRIREQSYFRPNEDISGRPDPRGVVGDTAGRTWAAFLQDSWNPTSNITINAGVRWEGQQLFGLDYTGATGDRVESLAIWDNWAPRFGGTWDFLGGGRSKIFANWGRFYQQIPLDITDRQFGGEGIGITDYRLNPTGAGAGAPGTVGTGRCAGDPNLVTDVVQQCAQFYRRLAFGQTSGLVAPGLKGQYTEEVQLGAQVEFLPSWVGAITAIHRNLGRGIEDVSTDGGSTYLVANPGEFDVNRLEDVDQDIARETDPLKRGRLQQLRNRLAAINNFPKPVRRYLAIQFNLDKRFRNDFQIQASYLLSWTRGNFPGLFSENNGQLDPNITTTYDLPTLLVNRSGYLPQDQRHRLKFFGFYQGDLRKLGSSLPIIIIPGAGINASSGRPYDALGSDPAYGTDEAFLIKRGEGGRTPWIWSADVSATIRYQIEPLQYLDFRTDIYNVTNNQGATRVDDTYTFEDADPIVNGRRSDLRHVRTVDGRPVRVNPNYRQPTQYQAPLTVQFALRYSF